MGSGGAMFLITVDKYLKEYTFECGSCGQSLRYCEKSILPIHCKHCQNLLVPIPQAVIENKTYRVGYHFLKGEIHGH